MSLHNTQISLVKLMSGGSSVEQISHEPEKKFTPSELEWLRYIERDPGMKVTSQVHHWWRAARIRLALPLSYRLIEQQQEIQLIENYTKDCLCKSIFFAEEAENFKNYVLSQQTVEVSSLLNSMLSFESAVQTARERVELFKQGEAKGHFFLTLVFEVEPLSLIMSLLNGQDVSELPKNEHKVQISSSLDNCWRVVAS